MVSLSVNDPTGIVVAKDVVVGELVIEAVAPLVPPVIVSPTVKLPVAATERVNEPEGYSLIPAASVMVVCSMVH